MIRRFKINLRTIGTAKFRMESWRKVNSICQNLRNKKCKCMQNRLKIFKKSTWGAPSEPQSTEKGYSRQIFAKSENLDVSWASFGRLAGSPESSGTRFGAPNYDSKALLFAFLAPSFVIFHFALDFGRFEIDFMTLRNQKIGFSSRRNANFHENQVLVYSISFSRNVTAKCLRFEDLERIKNVAKCPKNKDCADWLDKRPCIGHSMPEAALGLQISLSSLPSALRAGTTKIGIVIIILQ